MDIPVTLPDALTVATEGLLLLHEPPGVASLRVATQPTQVLVLPIMGSMAYADIAKNKPIIRAKNFFIMLCLW